MPVPSLLLASSSPARQQLLTRLGLPFRHESPDIDESPLPNEPIGDMVRRLSEAKARALATDHPDHLIIGSDQALDLDGQTLGKPGNHERATEQLRHMSGRRITFHTGLCLLNTASGRCQLTVETYTVQFRVLDAGAIDRYLRAEQPYGCAGSFKSEGLGISLFQAFAGRDPNSLIGLPLMALVDMLQTEGLSLP